MSKLEEEGLIQRFKYTFELAWKCLQDLLAERGYANVRGPRPVIEQAFQDGIITEGPVWLEMLKARNETTHLYNQNIFESIKKTVKDLALNACHIKPEPFVPGAFTPYEYWICFENKNILAICEDQHFSNEDGHVGRVQVEAHDHQIAYQFIAARPWAIRDCIDFVKTLKNLVRGTSHACISASYIDKEKKNQRGQMERIGIFNRIKTDKGCEGKECVFTEKIRQEYCPDLKL